MKLSWFFANAQWVYLLVK